MASITCLHCGATFARPPSLKAKYCSRACANAVKASRKEAKCQYCGTSFWFHPSNKAGKYCSRACDKKAKAKPLQLCQHCHKPYGPSRDRGYNAKFCSLACAQKGKSKGAFINCEICGIRVHIAPYDAIKRRFCSRKCFAVWRSSYYRGPLNNNWKGGISIRDGSRSRVYAKGVSRERKTRRWLEREGYYVVRSGGSKGLWDLIAYAQNGQLPEWRIIQVKTNGKPPKDELASLWQAPVPEAARKEIWIWFDRQKIPTILLMSEQANEWIPCALDDFSKQRPNDIACIREELRLFPKPDNARGEIWQYHERKWVRYEVWENERLRELIADLADSLRDFGADQEERRSSKYRRAAEALDRADALAGMVRGE